MNWKMNRAVDFFSDFLKKLTAEGFATLNIGELAEQSKEAPVKEFEGAGNIGTAVHSWREAWFNYWILTGDNNIANVPQLPNVDKLLGSRFAINSWLASTEAIKRCIADLQAQPLACELPLADRQTETGGMGDDIWAVPIFQKEATGTPEMGQGYKVKVKWEYWFVDLKTSNIGNKDSYMLQVATYVHMFEKLYKIKIHKVFILHTSKERFGDYELIPVKEPKRLWQIAKVAFKLSDMLSEVKEIKKLKGVSI
jgi:hypothetical protein